MTLRLDRLSLVPIVGKDGKPTQQFQRLWQKTVENIEAQEAAQDQIIADLFATQNRIRRINSHTLPTTILKATEDGVSVTIEVMGHTRVYADGTTVNLTGDTQTGFLPDTLYACYYDDPTLAETAPTFVITDVIENAPAAMAPGRHFCGMILTPALASGDVIESGGSYSPGTSLYGEMGIEP